MENRRMSLKGNLVVVCEIQESSIEDYLCVFREGSAFSEMYAKMPDFWHSTEVQIRESFRCEKSDQTRYLISKRDSSEKIGYIDVTYNSPVEAEIDIAILMEHRKKGYAFEASTLLINYLLYDTDVEYVIWSAFLSNFASRRIAEKLGGIPIERKNFLKEIIRAAGYNESLAEAEGLKTISYRIGKATKYC